jgi:molybdopterin/thiamine biosynthesis adenylyltransferase
MFTARNRQHLFTLRDLKKTREIFLAGVVKQIKPITEGEKYQL